MMLNTPDPTPAEQLQFLEDAYAELMMENTDAATLSQLWKSIKELRKELNLPIYEYVTPKEERQ